VNDVLYTLSIWVLPVVLAVTLHEAAHGWVAWKLGDPTAHARGRVTFNPLKHVDPFGTVVLPLLLYLSPAPFLFGYARPVPVNFRALRKPRRDMVLVALAGPGINLALALLAAILLRGLLVVGNERFEWVMLNLANAMTINVILAVFNMLPIPPPRRWPGRGRPAATSLGAAPGAARAIRAVYSHRSVAAPAMAGQQARPGS